jgi:hypothetical protein
MISLLCYAESDVTAFRRVGPAELYHCRDAETAIAIVQQKELAGSCFLVGTTTLVVLANAVPKFQKMVEKFGLGIV